LNHTGQRFPIHVGLAARLVPAAAVLITSVLPARRASIVKPTQASCAKNIDGCFDAWSSRARPEPNIAITGSIGPAFQEQDYNSGAAEAGRDPCDSATPVPVRQIKRVWAASRPLG